MASPNRRQVLAGAAAGMVAIPGRLRAGEGDVARLEPLVRFVMDSPRDRLIEAAAAKVHAGTDPHDLLVATFLAGARAIKARPVGFELHCVLAIHSVQLAVARATPADRWLAIAWAMDDFKKSQETKRRKHEDGWHLAPLAPARLPAADQARGRFLRAMDDWDEEGADVAATALARTASLGEMHELFFRYGARDFRDIGHKAIYAANGCRAIDRFGYWFAEPVLRSMAFALLSHDGSNPARRDAPEDRPYRVNQERARRLGAARAGHVEPRAARDLLAQLRQATPAEASDAVAKLAGMEIDRASIWDGLFLFAAELALRHRDIIALHAVTTTNALYRMAENTRSDELRNLALLQAPAFLALFRDELGSGGGERIDALTPLPARPAEALATVGDVEGARKMLGALEAGDPRSVLAAAQRQVFLKGSGAHDYKLSSAVFEDFDRVSEPFRNRYLAATSVLLPSSRRPDAPLVARARAALA